MAQKLDPNELVNFKELLMANSIQVDTAVLPRSYAATFPKRSPPWLFTSAALGGLKPAPASRLRGAKPSSSVQLRTLYEKRARGTLN